MPVSLTTLDAVRDCLAEAVATPQHRTATEQRALLADLLALAFAARAKAV